MPTGLMVTLLVDLALVFAASRLLGMLAGRLGQPAVVAEIVAGILVGPTLLDGAIGDLLFPKEARPYLTAFANLGVALFMFTVGFELEPRKPQRMGRTLAAVSIGSVLPTFGFGTLLAWALPTGRAGPHATAFILFMGLAMSVTALPVLARILHDRGMNQTALGNLAVSCSAVTDALAWAMLALVAVLASSKGDQWRFLLAPLFLGGLLLLRPLARRLMERAEQSGGTGRPQMFAVVVPGLFLAGACTEWMGLHYIIGAFLFGLVLPKAGLPGVRAEIDEDVRKLGVSLLLPVFFVTAGLQVDLSGVGTHGLGLFALIMLIAMGAKLVGVYVSARAFGMDSDRSATLAILLNARGLTELVILSAGLSLGLLDRELYSLMVLMAVATTTLTGPLLNVLTSRSQAGQQPVPAVADPEAATTRGW